MHFINANCSTMIHLITSMQNFIITRPVSFREAKNVPPDSGDLTNASVLPFSLSGLTIQVPIHKLSFAGLAVFVH